MNEAKKPEDAPGHYGAGYGEQVPEGATPRPAPVTDDDQPAVLDVEVPNEPHASADPGDGAPVTFTPDDVHVPPPDRPPTEQAPESEKAGLLFERS